MSESYSYRYPNPASYALLQSSGANWQGRGLRHGYIFGYKDVSLTDSSANADPRAGNSAHRQIDYRRSKVFQFNPPALAMTLQMMTVESPEQQASGGALGTPAVGLATSTLELFFDRTEEIARANNGHKPEIWGELGVQQDLFDLLKVISGGDSSALGVYSDVPAVDAPGDLGGTVQTGSMNHLTGRLLDAAVAGTNLRFKPFVVVFNPNLSMNVMQMTSFAFTYLRFTGDLVPTTVKVEMGLEITNMGTKSYIVSQGSAAAVTTAGNEAGFYPEAPPGAVSTPPVVPG